MHSSHGPKTRGLSLASVAGRSSPDVGPIVAMPSGDAPVTRGTRAWVRHAPHEAPRDLVRAREARQGRSLRIELWVSRVFDSVLQTLDRTRKLSRASALSSQRRAGRSHNPTDTPRRLKFPGDGVGRHDPACSVVSAQAVCCVQIGFEGCPTPGATARERRLALLGGADSGLRWSGSRRR
jgi:hypothetical protein